MELRYKFNYAILIAPIVSIVIAVYVYTEFRTKTIGYLLFAVAALVLYLMIVRLIQIYREDVIIKITPHSIDFKKRKVELPMNEVQSVNMNLSKGNYTVHIRMKNDSRPYIITSAYQKSLEEIHEYIQNNLFELKKDK